MVQATEESSDPTPGRVRSGRLPAPSGCRARWHLASMSDHARLPARSPCPPQGRPVDQAWIPAGQHLGNQAVPGFGEANSHRYEFSASDRMRRGHRPGCPLSQAADRSACCSGQGWPVALPR